MADDEVRFHLAVSLHCAIQEIREQIMPFANRFTLVDLQEALEYWYERTQRRVTYEYIVWDGINDTKEAIDALVQFCQHIPCKVNLIEYNSIGDPNFRQAKPEWIDAYISGLEANHISVTVRRSRGEDIDAACGQLANKH